MYSQIGIRHCFRSKSFFICKDLSLNSSITLPLQRLTLMDKLHSNHTICIFSTVTFPFFFYFVVTCSELLVTFNNFKYII